MPRWTFRAHGRSGEMSWFDPDVSQVWKGTKLISRWGFGTRREAMYRTPRGEWVLGSFMTDRISCSKQWFSEKTPEKAAEWFNSNGFELPEALCIDLDRRRKPPDAQSLSPSSVTLPTTTTEPPPAGKASAASGTRRQGARDKGYDDKCRVAYLGYLERKETPPTPTAIAKEVGCSVSTASRAIKHYEDKRKEYAKEDLQSRQKGR